MTQWHETEPRTLESDELQNARALIEKLQGLNASLQHQVTALHTEIAHADEQANELRAQLAQQADPEPDIDTVPLADLLEAIAGTLRRSGARPQALDTATARSALLLLSRPEPERLKICPNCQWLFLDRSRNRSRAWCDMAVCGNRAKASRHYRRNREDQRP